MATFVILCRTKDFLGTFVCIVVSEFGKIFMHDCLLHGVLSYQKLCIEVSICTYVTVHVCTFVGMLFMFIHNL
jgi:hypothetical protein